MNFYILFSFTIFIFFWPNILASNYLITFSFSSIKQTWSCSFYIDLSFLAVIFLYSYLPSVHQPSLGVYRGNAWSAAIGRRDWPQQKMRFLTSDWPKWSRCLGWVSEPWTNQIQTSVPSREENRGGVSAFVHCNLTAPESRQPSPDLLSLRTGYTELSVIIVGFYF